jgi:hypothetical protein
MLGLENIDSSLGTAFDVVLHNAYQSDLLQHDEAAI